jgi:hypothetical protein
LKILAAEQRTGKLHELRAVLLAEHQIGQVAPRRLYLVFVDVGVGPGGELIRGPD